MDAVTPKGESKAGVEGHSHIVRPAEMEWQKTSFPGCEAKPLYFDPKTGHEFSAVAGLTGNFENHSTNYTSGIDFHLDWGASQFLSKQVQVGLVGYFYEQLTGDDGCAPILCPFKSRVIGIGPQIGYIFPVGGMQGYLNLKGYGEFDNDNRPDGWNVWLTFVLSPAPPSSASSSPPPMLTKTPRS